MSISNFKQLQELSRKNTSEYTKSLLAICESEAKKGKFRYTELSDITGFSREQASDTVSFFNSIGCVAELHYFEDSKSVEIIIDWSGNKDFYIMHKS